MPNLFIDIEARFAKFQDSLDTLQRQSNQFVSGLTKSFGLLRNVGIGIGAGLGLEQLTNAFQTTINAADELNNVSEKTGIAVSALSELKFAAELNNVAFEDLQTGLRAFAKSIDNADQAFERIGLNAKQFNNLEDALSAVADRFAKIQNPIQAASLAMELFGKNGAALLPLLQKGSAGIQQFREEARKLNIVISDDFAKAADEYNDNIERIGAAWQGLKNRLAGSILPFLGQAAEELILAMKTAGSLSGAISLAATTSPGLDPAKKIRETEDQVRELERRLERIDLQGGGGEFDFFGSSVEKVEDLNKKLAETRKTLEYLRGLRDIQIKNDPKLQALAETGKGIRDNTNITNAGSINVGDKTPDKDGKGKVSAGQSDFESLRRSLISQLQSEKKLTEELTLLEDERFKKLAPAQQRQLRGIALTIDAIRQEKTNRESIDSATNAEASIREESLRTELDAIERRKVVLSQSYEDGKLSAAAYYSAVNRAETESTLLRIANLRQLADEQEAIAEDPARPNSEQLDAKVRLAGITREIIELNREQADVIVRNSRAQRQADEAELRRKIEIAQQVNDALNIKNPELDRAALLDQFKDLPEEFKQTVTFQAFIDTRLAEKQLAEFERDAGVIEQTLRIKEERITVDKENGFKTSAEARGSIVEARKTAIVELDTLVKKYEDARRASGAAFGPEQNARLEELKTKLQELRVQADEYSIAFKEIGEGPTQQFFEDFLSGTVTAADAFDRFVKSVQANILKLTAEDLTKGLFGFIKGDGSEGSGLGGLIGSAAKAFGFGTSEPPKQTQGANLTSDGAGLGFKAASFATDLFSVGGESKDGNKELQKSATEAAASLVGLTTNSESAGSSVEEFSSSFSVYDAVGSLVDYVVSTFTAKTANETLATATTTAATQIAAAGATAAAGSSFSADGNVFSSGYQIAFAKGGAFDDGQLQAFATGGIVHKPTTFPIKDGRTGLMGEAGPEAIMPLTKGAGGFAVYAVDSEGKSTTLNITRNASGKLAVKLPSAEGASTAPAAFAKGGAFYGGDIVKEAGLATAIPSKAFAKGGAFASGLERYVMQFADGGVFSATANNLSAINAQTFSSQSSSIQSAITSNLARLDALPIRAYAYGGVANKPQVAVFGEGSRPEAFVPLPDGKSIPVTMDASQQGVTVIQNISTPDANSFRRSRSVLFNDIQAGLGTAAAKS